MRKKRIKIISLIICIVSISTQSGHAEEMLATNINDTIKKYVDESAFSGAIIVESKGATILENGYGYADRENKIRFTVDTIAQIGSITKQFTAIVALTLADEGKLNLYVPIKEYLPEAPEPGASLTIHQLMTHSSGLDEYCGSDDFETLSRSDFIANCLSKPLLFESGSKSEYSNVGFSVVAAIIERVTNQQFEDVLKVKVLEPNGLDSTGYFFKGVEESEFAYGYNANEKEELVSSRIQDMEGDWWVLKGNGGVQASARDMLHWHHALRGRGQLKAQTAQASMTPRFAEDSRLYVAYGWYIFFARDGEILQITHSGSDGTFYSYFWWNPRDDLFFYLVGNAGEEVTRDLVRDVRKLMYEFGEGFPR